MYYYYWCRCFVFMNIISLSYANLYELNLLLVWIEYSQGAGYVVSKPSINRSGTISHFGRSLDVTDSVDLFWCKNTKKVNLEVWKSKSASHMKLDKIGPKIAKNPSFCWNLSIWNVKLDIWRPVGTKYLTGIINHLYHQNLASYCDILYQILAFIWRNSFSHKVTKCFTICEIYYRYITVIDHLVSIMNCFINSLFSYKQLL